MMRHEVPIPTEDGDVVRVLVPDKMTSKDWRRFFFVMEAWRHAAEAAVVRSEDATEQPNAR